jgi:predicted transcriptional regulator
MKGVKEGVLAQVFGGPVAKVLDQSVYVGAIEQTIPMLAESTGLSFKTAQKAVLKLNKLGLVKQSRRIGNTQTYKFDVRNDLHELIDWAEKVKVSRLRR